MSDDHEAEAEAEAFTRVATRHETLGLISQTEALAAMVRMLDELDEDGLHLHAGIWACPELDVDGDPTGDRDYGAWVEVTSAR